MSLAGSRQSLTGSRSHLASPAERPTSNISMVTDKGDTPVTVQTDISTNNSKRASFVEVFIELLDLDPGINYSFHFRLDFWKL